MSDPIIHVSDYLRAMGIDHLSDLWRLEPEERRRRFGTFEADVAAGRIRTHGDVPRMTPPRLGDPVKAAMDDADIGTDRAMTKEYRQQCVKDGVPQKFQRLLERRMEAYIREHDLDPLEASWHALNDLCHHGDDEVRLWTRRIRAARLALVLKRDLERV